MYSCYCDLVTVSMGYPFDWNMRCCPDPELLVEHGYLKKVGSLSSIRAWVESQRTNCEGLQGSLLHSEMD